MSNEEQTKFRSVAARINFLQRTERASSLHPRTYAGEWPVLTRVTGKKHGELRDISCIDHEQFRYSTSRMSRSKCKDLPTLTGQESGQR